jgi:hypothetical protein
MAGRILVTDRLRPALLALAIAAMCLRNGPALAETDAVPAAHDDSVVESQPGTGAQMIYIDPQTGLPGTPPEPDPKAKLNARSTVPPPAPALVEEPLPSGGFKLDTQGLNEPLQATVDADGNVVIHHGEQP